MKRSPVVWFLSRVLARTMSSSPQGSDSHCWYFSVFIPGSLPIKVRFCESMHSFNHATKQSQVVYIIFSVPKCHCCAIFQNTKICQPHELHAWKGFLTPCSFILAKTLFLRISHIEKVGRQYQSNDLKKAKKILPLHFTSKVQDILGYVETWDIIVNLLAFNIWLKYYRMRW